MGRVLVTGATGLLGATLVPALRLRGHTVFGQGHQTAADVQADLTDAAATAALLDAVRPDVVVNLAALTDVDRCEIDPQQAYRLNVRSVENLAQQLRLQGPASHLVQVSTDQVYDGTAPQREDQVCIRNVYALSKLAGELAAAHLGPGRHTVLRTNFYGRSLRAGRSSFTDWLHAALSQQQPVTVFEDVLFSPLAIDTLADCMAQVVARRPAGVFNLGARGGLSKADFAHAFAAAAGLPVASMRRGRVADLAHLKARRPHDMRMDSHHVEAVLGLQLPDLDSEIQRIGSSYREDA